MDNNDQQPTAEELRLFSERIAQRLAGRPLDVDPASHRERVAALLRQSGEEASFYQLLGVVPTATGQEIHEAYDGIARMVHPANAGRLGLAGREGVLELLFERITQAYLTLSQPERRKVYDRELTPSAWASAWNPTPGRRRDEARVLAERYYERSLALIAAEDYHFAIELLQQAVRTDPRPEYHALLGKLQAKNPRWLRAAAENLEQALRLGSRDNELPAALSEVQERLASGEALRPDATADLPSRRKGNKEEPDVEVLDPGGEIDVAKSGKRWR